MSCIGSSIYAKIVYKFEKGMEHYMTKEQEIMSFLHEKVFDPVLNSKTASKELKAGINLTIARMLPRDAVGMIHYFWAAVIGTEKSIGFAAMMKKEGFNRFEEAIDDFRIRFGDEWIGSR